MSSGILTKSKYTRWFVSKLPVYVVLILFSIMAILPFFFVINTSLKTESEYLESTISIAKQFSIESYVYAFKQAKMGIYLRNSLIVVPIALVVYILICCMAGFSFGRLRFPGRMPLFLLVLFMMIFPQMIISSQIYQFCVKLKLINTYVGIILVWVAYFSLFGTYIMTTFYSSVPKELIESAKIDGANIYQIMFRIMIPIARSMIVTLGLIGFKAFWGELPFSLLLLVRDNMRTVILGLAMMKGEHGIHMVKLSAGIMIAVFVPLLVYLALQRYLEMGVTAGSLKE